MARVIQILRTYGDPRGLAVENAVVHGLDLANADLSDARLAGTHWSECNLGHIRLDGADLRGAVFQKVSFQDVTLRDAILTSTEWDERSTIAARIGGAAWARGPNGHVVVVSTTDNRFFVVDPRGSHAVEIPAPVGSGEGWQNRLVGVVDCPPVGQIDFGALPGDLKGISARSPWRMPVLADGVVMTYEQTTLATDVDQEEVRTRASGQELVTARFVDASGRGSTENYFITVSPSGRMIAGLRGSFNRDKQVTLTRNDTEITLEGSSGEYGISGSFSPDESLLAITESRGKIVFWRTDTAAFAGRFAVPVAVAGASVQDAVGLGPGVLGFATAHPDGWSLDREGWPVS